MMFAQRRTSVPRPHVRPFENSDVSIWHPLKRGRVTTEQFSPPPHSGGPPFCHGSEPVLPYQRANLLRWPLRKRVACKEIEHVFVVGQKENFRVRDERIFTP